MTETTLLESAWRLQHRAEAWYNHPRPQKGENPGNLRVSSEWIMIGGVVWAILGFILWEYYWILGGFLLFFMGVMTIPSKAGTI